MAAILLKKQGRLGNMSSIKSILAARNKAKRSMPDFLVKESKFVGRIESRWRYPMGRHSKVRQRHCGRPAMPAPGYGSPRIVRGLHSSGLKPVLVATVKELQSLDAANEGAVLVSTIGGKKRLSLLQFALDNQIRVINVRDSKKSMEAINQQMAERKRSKLEKLEVKSKKQQEKERKAEEKKKKEAEKKDSKKEESEKKERYGDKENLAASIDAINAPAQESAVAQEEEKRKEQQREMEKIITQR